MKPTGANAPLALGLLGLAALAGASVLIGAGGLGLSTLMSGDAGGHAALVLMASRVPRTLSLLFAGMSMGVCAALMQMLFRNRFVEPTTAGTAEAASLGLLLAALVAPGMPMLGKMAVAAAFALAGTVLFLKIVERIGFRGAVIVPLVGLMLGGVINALTTFLAYRYDLLQSLAAWTTGDFSGVLRGRYELLWLTLALAGLAYLAADRFTVAGLGEAVARNLGLDYGRTVAIGITIVALATAACIATAGTVPFLGLIVANGVSLVLGDNLRRTLPWIALSGAAFLLACDMVGRLIRQPYEIPVGAVAGVAGSAMFLLLLLGRRARLG
ncbi:iron chelate uptake ABC transporter family permease subunit [Xanthobacter autotrophicus DSM 431]|uniref:ABC transporter permease n=1 Tax=Xanthobacter nonsaccharivorans TaxID=3119912 RepID=UPI0037270A07